MNKESERVMKWQKANPEKFNANKKKYLATSKAKEKHRLLQQKYRQQQKQKIIDLQSQLDIANNKLKEVKEYLSNYKEPLYIPDDLLKFLESIIGGE